MGNLRDELNAITDNALNSYRLVVKTEVLPVIIKEMRAVARKGRTGTYYELSDLKRRFKIDVGDVYTLVELLKKCNLDASIKSSGWDRQNHHLFIFWGEEGE